MALLLHAQFLAPLRQLNTANLCLKGIYSVIVSFAAKAAMACCLWTATPAKRPRFRKQICGDLLDSAWAMVLEYPPIFTGISTTLGLSGGQSLKKSVKTARLEPLLILNECLRKQQKEVVSIRSAGVVQWQNISFPS